MCAKSDIRKLTSLAMLFAFSGLYGCVSNTLSVENTQTTPEPLLQNAATTTQDPLLQNAAVTGTDQDVNYDPIQRAQAVAEIRAKVENSSTPELTTAYTVNDSPTRPLTAEEQAAKLAELNRTVETQNRGITDAELEAKQRSIRELQARGQNHYESAVKTIQN